MANRSEDRKLLRCSFCNKTQDQVRKLIAKKKKKNKKKKRSLTKSWKKQVLKIPLIY